MDEMTEKQEEATRIIESIGTMHIKSLRMTACDWQLRFFYDNAWRWKCGLPELYMPENKPAVTYEELKASEWNNEFEELMRNRLIMGALRYGRIGASGKPHYERTNSMIKRLNKYSETGNKEFLVDVANLCMLEFVECHHPKAHFGSIDDGEHVEIARNNFINEI